jgi:hypothetical protein
MGWDQLVSPCCQGITGSTTTWASMSSSWIHSGYCSMVAVWFLYSYRQFDLFRRSTSFIDHQTITRKVYQGDHWFNHWNWVTTSAIMGSITWIYRFWAVLLLRFTTIKDIRNHAILTSTTIVFGHCDHIRFSHSIPMSARPYCSILGTGPCPT